MSDFSFAEPGKYTIDMPPIAVDDHFYEVRRGKILVGYVSASFDFTNLPPDYHALVLKAILQQGMRIHINV